MGSTDGLSKPSITTVDRKGNVYVPDETGHLVPTTNKLPQLSNDEPEAEQLLLPAPEVQMDIDSLQTNPETFLGSDVYKYFHNAGVEHGLVTQILPRSRWEVVFDDGFVQEFDIDDMKNFVINCIYGKEVIPDTIARQNFYGRSASGHGP